MPDNNVFSLPDSIAQPIDVNHIIHELDLIDEHLNQAAIRDPNKQIEVKASFKLRQLLEANNIDIRDKRQRTMLIGLLQDLKTRAPTVNMSFSTEAGSEFIERIIQWYRANVSPYCLITVGMNPTIGVGTIVRTDNKVFDFSLKSQLAETRNLLEKRIRQINIEVPSE